ncbi:hypothetical protein KSS87_013537 [Heliosperma pusillum]|nr:hypothetical protein KSS87_013537 [Heliosperma pusillum]
MPFQGKENSSDSSYQVKDFKTESSSKKLDLPVQKNLLTNYFCFASLEAKRKFSAPRLSPTNSDLANRSSPTLPKQVHQDALDHKTNVFSGFSSDEVVHQSDVKSSHDFMEIKLSGKKIEDSNSSKLEGSWSRSALEQSCHSIPKPCSVLRNGVNGDLRNSLIQQNLVDENGPVSKRDSSTLKSSYFLEQPDENDLSRRSKKVVVRSSYFKHKPRKTLETDENNRSSIKDNSSVVAEIEKITPETDLVGNDFDDDKIMKRKASPNQIYIEVGIDFFLNVQKTSLLGQRDIKKQLLGKALRCNDLLKELIFDNVYFPAGTDIITDTDELTEVKREEEKFGCKISHLKQYSDISEKSMDKFVSVISSFRFSSSGSRASGLRAPLKDVKNVCPVRSVAPAEIANFSYVPNNGKVALNNVPRISRPGTYRAAIFTT